MKQHNNEQRLLAEAFYSMQGLKVHMFHINADMPAGTITNLKGEVIGYHESLEFFWVGKSIEVGIMFKSATEELIATKIKFDAQEVR